MSDDAWFSLQMEPHERGWRVFDRDGTWIARELTKRQAERIVRIPALMKPPTLALLHSDTWP